MPDSPADPLGAQHVLIVSPDTLGRKMGGPAIRAWEMAKRLAAFAPVRLVSVKEATLAHEAFEVLSADDDELRRQVAWADVVIAQGEVFTLHPWLNETDVVIVADVYDPLHLEALESARDEGPEGRRFLVGYCVDMLSTQLRRADFVICASEKQRDFWLGHLGALGRISPDGYDDDHSLRNLIDVVPFGVSDDHPSQTRHGIRDAEDGIGPDDKVVLWGGGVYNWFDPLTLIRAVHQLTRRRPEVKLYFLGMTYPNPAVRESRMAVEAVRLADELGLTGTQVFFNTGWTDYDDRINFLLDADVGVSTHFDHIETAFSFRTRILDYLWAGLPIIATDGDAFAPMIRDNGLGRVVPAQDVGALVAALEEVLFEADGAALRENARAFGRTMSWDRSLRPLIEFCRSPRHAADFSAALGLPPDAHHLRHIEVLEAKILQLDDELNQTREQLSSARRQNGL
ncbi:glycosyltransferase family 4 protein [Microbacterium azadirachtae]|uniref:D-inositol-3-phosphate glycosyltransferase n=1 Tax=Microbacterium azadirachtae TaxID=582680 RepID=A0A0F0KQK2_9MICO|nr:glycosyltransferase family 4 protein [Microbacterium azadirachtae]KJL21531.1 D-inositol-3-phosphate glycosyltransferase [Microbacterium azadirachtae]UXW84855.1 glycosyltransferase family 4 protein [Microbacterium azadirachtae]